MTIATKYGLGFLAGLALIVGLAVLVLGHQSVHADSSASTFIGTMPVVKSVTCGPNSSTQALATSTARLWVYLSATTTVPIFVNMSDSSSTYPTGSGLVVQSTEPLTVGSENLYTGSIQCSATASTTLFVTADQ